MDERQKLPQSRYYLRAAHYGIDSLLREQAEGAAFLFYAVGILASLRAVQHALLNYDSKLSRQHTAVIEEWRKTVPMDDFIKTARDEILKGGAFEAFAVKTEFGWGEGSNYQPTRGSYKAVYYSGEDRRDLIEEMRRAADWCDQQLSKIEAQVPLLAYPHWDARR
jgi:hypothetical protein